MSVLKHEVISALATIDELEHLIIGGPALHDKFFEKIIKFYDLKVDENGDFIDEN